MIQKHVPQTSDSELLPHIFVFALYIGLSSYKNEVQLKYKNSSIKIA